MQHQEGVLTSNAREDERWDTAASIVKTGVREAICVPMQGRYGVVGVIYIDTYTPPGTALQNRHVNKFSDEHLKLMVAIGHQAALASKIPPTTRPWCRPNGWPPWARPSPRCRTT